MSGSIFWLAQLDDQAITATAASFQLTPFSPVRGLHSVRRKFTTVRRMKLASLLLECEPEAAA